MDPRKIYAAFTADYSKKYASEVKSAIDKAYDQLEEFVVHGSKDNKKERTLAAYYMAMNKSKEHNFNCKHCAGCKNYFTYTQYKDIKNAIIGLKNINILNLPLSDYKELLEIREPIVGIYRNLLDEWLDASERKTVEENLITFLRGDLKNLYKIIMGEIKLRLSKDTIFTLKSAFLNAINEFQEDNALLKFAYELCKEPGLKDNDCLIRIGDAWINGNAELNLAAAKDAYLFAASDNNHPKAYERLANYYAQGLDGSVIPGRAEYYAKQAANIAMAQFQTLPQDQIKKRFELKEFLQKLEKDYPSPESTDAVFLCQGKEEYDQALAAESAHDYVTAFNQALLSAEHHYLPAYEFLIKAYMNNYNKKGVNVNEAINLYQSLMRDPTYRMPNSLFDLLLMLNKHEDENIRGPSLNLLRSYTDNAHGITEAQKCFAHPKDFVQARGYLMLALLLKEKQKLPKELIANIPRAGVLTSFFASSKNHIIACLEKADQLGDPSARPLLDELKTKKSAAAAAAASAPFIGPQPQETEGEPTETLGFTMM